MISRQHRVKQSTPSLQENRNLSGGLSTVRPPFFADGFVFAMVFPFLNFRITRPYFQPRANNPIPPCLVGQSLLCKIFHKARPHKAEVVLSLESMEAARFKVENRPPPLQPHERSGDGHQVWRLKWPNFLGRLCR